jgi:hypothetical protein
MTLNTTKTTETADKAALQQHHQKAGEHLQHAATNHLAAAKAMGAGDVKTSHEHAKVASEHTAHARQQVSHAEKIAAPAVGNPIIHAK